MLTFLRGALCATVCGLITVLAASLAWAQAGSTVAAPADGPTFDALEYAIEGNTVLSTNAIERAVYPFLGERKRIADVERARSALEQAYRDAGFVTVVVDIPVQKVDRGLVRLNVTEGRVERVRVTGSRYYSRGRILERTEALEPGEVPYFPDVQAQLDRLNRSADRRITPVLRPGTVPGATEFDLKVDDSLPLHGNVELNNRYSPSTTHSRLSASLRYDNFLQREHSLGLQFQTTPEDTSEVKVFLASYALPLGNDGSLYAYYVRSHSNVGALGALQVLGRGQIFGLRAAWPLPGRDAFSHSLTLGVDVKDFAENVTVPGQPGQQTPLRYTPFSIDYSAAHRGARAITQASLGAALSVRGLGNREQEFADKRFKAQSNFLALRWDLQHTRVLSDALSLFLRADGQLADQPLVSNEQMFAGGLNSVRGYLESEVLGDRGLHYTGELRASSMAPESSWLTEAVPFLFVEGATLRVRDPLPGQKDRFTLASRGAGLRAKARGGFELSFNVAWARKATAGTAEGRGRAQFSALYRF